MKSVNHQIVAPIGRVMRSAVPTRVPTSNGGQIMSACNVSTRIRDNRWSGGVGGVCRIAMDVRSAVRASYCFTPFTQNAKRVLEYDGTD